MAHFAEIDENNFVSRVLVIPNEEEHRFQEFITQDLGLSGTWIQTSYNTRGGIYYDAETNTPAEDQSKSLRKNHPGIGYFYDQERDAFIPPKPFPSWILDEQTCWWKPPVPMPETGGPWQWNEENQEWQEVITED